VHLLCRPSSADEGVRFGGPGKAALKASTARALNASAEATSSVWSFCGSGYGRYCAGRLSICATLKTVYAFRNGIARSTSLPASPASFLTMRSP